MFEQDMRCALCNTDGALCESHIFPKFSYKRMKAQEGSLLEFSTLRRHPDGRVVQDGFREKLLCRVCEGRFQRWEDYFARVVNQKRLFDLKKPADGKKTVLVGGLDYAKTKLFLLSILWRVSASTDPRFQVGLGEKHEKRLREMLLADDPGLPTEYGCVLAVPFIEFEGDESAEVRPATTVTPENVRWLHGLRLVRMQIDGVLLQFVIGAVDVIQKSDVRRLFLQKDGTLVVGIENMMNIWFLRDAWGKSLGFIG